MGGSYAARMMRVEWTFDLTSGPVVGSEVVASAAAAAEAVINSARRASRSRSLREYDRLRAACYRCAQQALIDGQAEITQTGIVITMTVVSDAT